MSALEAVRARRSHPRVSPDAPSRDELLTLVRAAATVADHGSLQPWRLIELRGDARHRLGKAFAADGGSADKPLRASLLIAVVAVHRPSRKVPEWEQDATASGVAHVLSLLLDEAGWGVIWRTGELTRAKKVAKVHKLKQGEKLLGWLYVGGKPERGKPGRKHEPKVEKLVKTLS